MKTITITIYQYDNENNNCCKTFSTSNAKELEENIKDFEKEHEYKTFRLESDEFLGNYSDDVIEVLENAEVDMYDNAESIIVQPRNYLEPIN